MNKRKAPCIGIRTIYPTQDTAKYKRSLQSKNPINPLVGQNICHVISGLAYISKGHLNRRLGFYLVEDELKFPWILLS